MSTETGHQPFRGWPADATAFLRGIAADNTAAFWAAHRHRHADAVQAPLRALAGELREEFGELRIFRPYRDRRFRPSADPYRTDAGALCTSAGGTVRTVVLSGTALAVELGRYAFDGPALRAYRAAVGAAAGADLAVVLAALTGGPGFVLDGTRRLAGRPRGAPPDHPRLDLLRHRGVLVRRVWPAGDWLGSAEPLRRVREAWRVAEPLVCWLDEHVGPA